MHLATHLLTGWTAANAVQLGRRDRAVVTAAGIIPDIDALGLLVEHTPLHAIVPAFWFSEYHHIVAHNIGFALLVVVFSGIISRRRLVTPLVAFSVFHLHLLGDIAGSRGPDGYQWPIPYLLPFSDVWQVTWQGQWALDAWPNIALTVILLCTTLLLAWKRGYSPVELISRRADAKLVEALRTRFGMPTEHRNLH